MTTRLDNNATKLAQLINPQVLADMVDKKLVNYIKFAPLATVDGTLEGRPGTTVTLPSYTYIGDAADVTEGEDITIGQLTEGSTNVTIKQAGKGVQVTDKAVLAGYGDPIGESARQLRTSIARKVNADMYTTMKGIASGMTYHAAAATTSTAATALTADDIADALVLFGEDIEGDKVLLVSPAQYAALRKADDWCPASEIAARLIIEGTVGMIHGCQVVISNDLATAKDAYIIKPGALRLYMKRGVMVESDRDIINKSTVITADTYYACYLYDASKAIKLVLTHA